MLLPEAKTTLLPKITAVLEDGACPIKLILPEALKIKGEAADVPCI